MTSATHQQGRKPPQKAPQGTAQRTAQGTAAPDDVARFTAIADSWWDPDGAFRPLHRLNPTRITYIRDQIAAHYGRDPLASRPLRDLTLLDIGCGGGLLCEPMRRLGARVSGIDASAESINVATLHAKQSALDIDYRCALPEDLAAQGARFDIVLNMEVIEHVADVTMFIDACCALIAPGGAMVVATLNRTIKALALAKVGAEYVMRWLPPGTHDWRQFVKPSELAAALRTGGGVLHDLTGMTYAPLSGEWSLGRDLDVNYLAFVTKPSAEAR